MNRNPQSAYWCADWIFGELLPQTSTAVQQIHCPVWSAPRQFAVSARHDAIEQHPNMGAPQKKLPVRIASSEHSMVFLSTLTAPKTILSQSNCSIWSNIQSIIPHHHHLDPAAAVCKSLKRDGFMVRLATAISSYALKICALVLSLQRLNNASSAQSKPIVPSGAWGPKCLGFTLSHSEQQSNPSNAKFLYAQRGRTTTRRRWL